MAYGNSYRKFNRVEDIANLLEGLTVIATTAIFRDDTFCGLETVYRGKNGEAISVIAYSDPYADPLGFNLEYSIQEEETNE